MIILTISQSSWNMGDVVSKTRSVGQIMEKPCEHSRSHSFGPIFIKLAQNNHLDNISVKFEYGCSGCTNGHFGRFYVSKLLSYDQIQHHRRPVNS